MEAVKKAEEAYFLATGNYTTHMEDLDITLPGYTFNSTDESYKGTDGHSYISLKEAYFADENGQSESHITALGKGHAYYHVYLDHSHDGTAAKRGPGDVKRTCRNPYNNPLVDRVCKSMGGKLCTDHMISYSYPIYCLK